MLVFGGVEDGFGAGGGEGDGGWEVEDFEDVQVVGFTGGEGGGEVVEVEAVEGIFEEGGEEGVDGLGAFGLSPEAGGFEAADLADALEGAADVPGLGGVEGFAEEGEAAQAVCLSFFTAFPRGRADATRAEIDHGPGIGGEHFLFGVESGWVVFDEGIGFDEFAETSVVGVAELIPAGLVEDIQHGE